MAKVECIKQFVDRKAGVLRNVGDQFEVTKERLKDLIDGGIGTVVKVIEEDKALEQPMEKKTRKRKAKE